MIYHRKRLILKRLNHLLKMRRIKQQYLINKRHKELGGDFDDQFSTQPDIPFEMLQFMTPKQRKKLRKSYPDLPQYLFMSQKEKEQYFEGKSREYQQNLDKEKQRVSKTKKIVKFARKFEVKPFSENEKVGKVKKTAAFKDCYKPEHYS